MEDLQELRPTLHPRDCRQAGLITTRRRGSSPSELVATPSISATVSCTTFRSGGLIGSSATLDLGLPNLFGHLPGESGERLATAFPVAADVDPQTGAATAQPVLHDRAHQLLDRLEGRAAGPDQQPQTLTFDLDQHRVVIDAGVDRPGETHGSTQGHG